MDVEPVSQHNPPTEPRGQERRFGRPTVAGVNASLSANVPAGIEGSVDVSEGLTVTGSNNDLAVKTDSAATAFTTVRIAPRAYETGAALVAAINVALGGLAGARLSDDALHVVLFSRRRGEGSYFGVDTSGLAGALGVAGNFTIPSAASIITAILPVGGPLDISDENVRSSIGDGASDAELSAFADSIAPRIIETDAAIKSFQVGMIAGYRSPSYNPDPSRYPRLTPGPAIIVVQDDGVTEFEAPMTNITGAAANAGRIMILGTNLGSPEVEETVVQVVSADQRRVLKLHQRVIVKAGGSVTPTRIMLPASLLSGLGVSSTRVRVQYTSFTSGLATVA
jgi:hypothetical protein